MKTIEQRIEELERRSSDPTEAHGNGRLIARREEGEAVEDFTQRVSKAAGKPRPNGVRIFLPDNGRPNI